MLPAGIKKHLRLFKCRLLQWNHGLKKVHPTVYIGKRCRISKDLEAEEHVYIGPRTHIGPLVSIGRYSMFGPSVLCTGDDHVFDEVGVPIIFSGRPELRKTSIGRDVWIGANSIILSGVTIADGAIVAAGTVVSRDISACEVHAGVPNKKIKDRFDTEDKKQSHLDAINQELISGDFPDKR